MKEIDKDIDSLLEMVADSEAEEDLLRNILEWESDRVSSARRYGKNEAMEAYIKKYIGK